MADQTARSRFLSEALDYYEPGNAQALLNLANEFWIETSSEDLEGISDEENLLFNEMLAKLRELQASVLVTNRVTVEERSQVDSKSIVLHYLGQMSPEGGQTASDLLVRVFQRLSEDYPGSVKDSGLNLLDSQYSRELINLLPTVVTKVAALQELDLKSVPRPSVQRYFREAHSCYFYGLNRACAVLCRAILEAALKEKLGANNLWQELIDKAGQLREGGSPLLDGERIESAKRVYRAGNLAVHDEELFDIRYQDIAVEALLLDMRKILEDVYTGSEEADA